MGTSEGRLLAALLLLAVRWGYPSVSVVKKPHLLFSRLLLCLILILEILHLFLKLFQELLDCGLIFSGLLSADPQILVLLNNRGERVLQETVSRIIDSEGLAGQLLGTHAVHQRRAEGARRLLLAVLGGLVASWLTQLEL